MQLLVTAEQMQRYDRTAIERYRIPGLVLMENAGRACVDELARRRSVVSGSRVLVMCGKGNNGGDGFVIARHLANLGCTVDVVLLGKRGEVKGDAKTNLTPILSMAADPRNGLGFREVLTTRGFGRPGRPDVIVDAIFGTGFSGSVTGIQQHAIEWINRQKAFVVSVDIPSGVNASSGVVENIAVQANLTITMALPKIGHVVGAGRDHTGELVVVDISIPRATLKPSREQAYRIWPEDVAAVLPKRPLTAHKYSVGKVFIVAGSRKFTGAPYMCAQTALRAGAGAVILGLPRGIHTVLARKTAELILEPLEETPEGTISLQALGAVQEKADWADVVILGPGMSRHPETDRLVLALLRDVRKPVVVDADGLNALALEPGLVKRRTAATILTPHSGELARLTGETSAGIETGRVDAARRAAKHLRSIVVLKGSPTVTAEPGGTVYLNTTGNPGMATIGSGDVLTGLIAGTWAQGMDALSAAYAGVYIHGKAGDLAAQKLGQKSMLAMDILDHVPSAISVLEG